MSQEPSKLEAVRRAREHLGEAPAQELAHFVEVKYGRIPTHPLPTQPAIGYTPESKAATESVYASNYRESTSGSNGYPAGPGSPLANDLVPYLPIP
jgi:hypothetical protein